MSTLKQKKVAKLIIENSTLEEPLNAGQIVEKSRYSKSMQIKPGLVINSQGVMDALDDYGFNENNAKRVVAEILLNEEVDPSNRLKASQEVFKVHGSYAPEKSVTLNVKTDVKEIGELEAMRLEYEEKLKNKLSDANA